MGVLKKNTGNIIALQNTHKMNYEGLINYSEALGLKNLGYNDATRDAFYKEAPIFSLDPKNFNNKDIKYTARPTYHQALQWFREAQNLSGEVYSGDFGGCIEYSFLIRDLYSEKIIFDNFFGTGSSYTGTFNTYEEAEIECLKKLIKLKTNE